MITGGGRRLGKALAEALIVRGAAVAVHYHTSDTGAREVLEFAEQHGAKAVALAADLADPTATARMFAEAAEALGSVDWLINNASIFEPLGLFDCALSDWQRHLAINLTAPFVLSKGFAEHRNSRGGVILNMLDYRAARPGPDHFPYTVSKAGLLAMTQSLAQLLAPEIRVAGLALGNILPPVDNPDERPSFRRTPIKRRGTVAETIESALFLLAGPAFITGEILFLDGGRHLT